MAIAIPPAFRNTGIRRLVDSVGVLLEGLLAVQFSDDFELIVEEAAGALPRRHKVSLAAGVLGEVPAARTITAGAGLTGGGDLSADRTINAVAHADGSIVVNPDSIQVGVLASDAQHGARGGGTQHALVTTSSHGFFSSTDKIVFDAIAAGTPLANANTYAKRDGNADIQFRDTITLGLVVGNRGSQLQSYLALIPKDLGDVGGTVTPDGLDATTGGSNLICNAVLAVTFAAPAANFGNGSWLRLTVYQDPTGPFAISFNAAYVFPNDAVGGSPIPSARQAPASKRDVYLFHKEGSEWICDSHTYTS